MDVWPRLRYDSPSELISKIKTCQKIGLLRLRNRLWVPCSVYYNDACPDFFIQDNITANKQHISDHQSEQAIRNEAFQQLNATLRTQLTVHHQMISDVRSVLKMMAKVPLFFFSVILCPLIWFSQCEPEDEPVSRYLDKYREFSELCPSVSRHLAAKEYDSLKVTEFHAEIIKLSDLLSKCLSFL